MQRLTALRSKEAMLENALRHATLTAPHVMNLNLSATFLATAVHCVTAFQECKDTTQKIGAAFFIGIRNSTGLPVSYQIANDNGINELLTRRMERKVIDAQDLPCFAGLADVGCPAGLRTCWVSLHYTAPLLRVYDTIPALYDIEPLVFADDVCVCSDTGNTTDNNNPIFAPICTLNGTSKSGETHFTLYCENADEAQLWRDAIQEAQKRDAALDGQMQRVKSMYADATSLASLSSRSSDVIVTTLPAHPSLTLKYFNQPYRKSPPRAISLTVADYPAFDLLVDAAESRFVPLQKEQTACEVFIETTIEGGRKILNVCSNTSVKNSTAVDMQFAFGSFVKDSDIAYSDVLAAPIRKGERQWMPVTPVASPALFLGKEELVRCVPLSDLQQTAKALLVNLATAEDPYYVYLTCEKRQVAEKGDAHTLRDSFCVVVTDVAQFENLLPVSVDFRVRNKYGVTAMEGTVPEGGMVSLAKCKFSKDESFRVEVCLTGGPFPFCDYAGAIDLVAASGTVHLEKRTEFKNLNLSFLTSRSAYHSVTVQLFCNYWLVNKTGEALLVRDAKCNDFEYTVASPPLELKNDSDVVYAKEELLLPSLISVKKKDKSDAIRLSLPGYEEFSEPFSINTLGVSGVVTITSKNRHQPEKAFGVAITRAPGVFARSFVVTVTPLYIVMNHMDRTVRLRQVQCDSEVVLKSKDYTSFHWTSKTAEHKVQLEVEGEEYEWSQGFELVPGHVSLQLTKKRDRVSRYDVWEHEELEDPVEHPYSVVQVDVTMIQSQCYVFLKNMVSACEEADA